MRKYCEKGGKSSSSLYTVQKTQNKWYLRRKIFPIDIGFTILCRPPMINTATGDSTGLVIFSPSKFGHIFFSSHLKYLIADIKFQLTYCTRLQHQMNVPNWSNH